jgi:carbonic anhydrase
MNQVVRWMRGNPTCLALSFTVAVFLGSSYGWSREAVSGLSPDEALAQLQQGNARYVTGNRTYPNLDANRITDVVDGQHPFATVITCSDSRVAPEHIFDAGLGDLFTIRVAGNVCDTDEIGSIEYGVDHLGTPVLIVLGHTHCGAVTAVVTEEEVHGSIPPLVDNILPAVAAAKKAHPELHGHDLVPAAVEANIWQAIEDLLQHSPATKERHDKGLLKIIGAVYHLDDGHVEWLGTYPEKNNLTNTGQIAKKAASKVSEAVLPKVTSAQEAMIVLKEGNARFVAHRRIYPHQNSARLQEIVKGQNPFVTVITCSDSRVPPEHLFDLGLGDVFVIRVAGNVCDVDEVGSIEYGVDHLGTPLMVVLGHTDCGAVTAVVTDAEVHGSIPQLVDNIKPAVQLAKRNLPHLHGNDLVPEAVKCNVWQAIDDLFKQSPAVRDRVRHGRVEVVGAIYDLQDGQVTWLGTHPRQGDLLHYTSGPAAAKH